MDTFLKHVVFRGDTVFNVRNDIRDVTPMHSSLLVDRIMKVIQATV